MDARFIWIDLSTFDLEKATNFYRHVLQWEISPDATGYTSCTIDGLPCAGLYEMPEFFQKIRMPSFWMTYIAVNDAKAVADQARQLGGKVELQEDNSQGQIALIRDPSGAGFTCYAGNQRAAQRDFSRAGGWCWTELLVSDIGLVRDFYTALFGWRIEPETEDRYSIKTADGEKIGAIQVAGEDIKGSKEFWAVYFATPDLSAATRIIEQAGGTVGGSYPHEYGTQMLVYDDQGAAFFVLQRDRPPAPAARRTPTKHLKWRALVGLLAIYLIILFEQDWAWAMLFLFWVLPDLKSGTTYFIEPLSRRSEPVLYWSVVLTWLALSAYMLLATLF